MTKKINYGWLSVLGLILIERLFWGLRYFPAMDDWFLYFASSLYENKWNDVIIRNDRLSLRPLAGIIDNYIISPLCSNIFIVSLFFTILLVFACYLLNKAFLKNDISCGKFLILLLVLFPLGIEATYWLSAASRIISSLFFISICAFSQTQYLENKKIRWLILYIVCGFFCVGFYETAIPIYALTCFTIWFKNKYKSPMLLLVPILYILLIGIYYKLNMQNPDLASRGGFVKAHFSEHIPCALYCMWDTFANRGFLLMTSGFKSGLSLLFEKPLFIPLIIALSVLFGYSYTPLKKDNTLINILIGFIFIVAGLIFNVILENIRIPLRVLFMGFIGLGIIAEAILQRFLNRYIYSIIAGIMALVFVIVGIGDLSVYKLTNDIDNKIADNIISIEENVTNPHKITYLLGSMEYYYDNGLKHFEHVKGVTEGYATITTIISYKTNIKATDMNNIMPIRDNSPISIIDEYLQNDIYIFLALEKNYDVSHVSLISTENGFDVVRSDGSIYGHITKNNDVYEFHMV